MVAMAEASCERSVMDRSDSISSISRLERALSFSNSVVPLAESTTEMNNLCVELGYNDELFYRPSRDNLKRRPAHFPEETTKNHSSGG